MNQSRNRLGLSLSGRKAFERLRVGETSLAVGRPSNYLVHWLPASDRQANTTFEDVTKDLRNQVNQRDMTYIDEILTLFSTQATRDADYALDKGLIHKIEHAKVPTGGINDLPDASVPALNPGYETTAGTLARLPQAVRHHHQNRALSFLPSRNPTKGARRRARVPAAVS